MYVQGSEYVCMREGEGERDTHNVRGPENKEKHRMFLAIVSENVLSIPSLVCPQ